MKIKNCKFTPKIRRGISSVVGALLFSVLMVAAFVVFGAALDTQTEIASTSRAVADTGLKKQQEQFGINVSTNSTQFLSIDVTNVGQNPTEIFTVLITNASDNASGFPTSTYEIPSETSFIPPGKTADIVSTLDLKMALAPSPGEKVLYTYKVISSLGTIKTVALECSFTECGAIVGGGDLIVQLFADGPTGVHTKISSIVMFVTNTADFTYTDVVPMRGFSDAPTTCNSLDPITADPFWMVLSAGTPDVFAEDITPCDFDAIAPIDLGPHETTLFKWDATMSGDIDTVFEFCNRVTGDDNLGDAQYSSISCDTLTIIDPNDCGGCGPGGEGGETIILIDDLLIRPSIFMIVPSPFGDTENNKDYTGLWGVNVANPTIKDMVISKVTIVVYPPGGNSQDTVFQAEGVSDNKCKVEDITPNKGTQPQGYWSCPRDNILMWQSFTDTVTVPANTTKSFLARAEPYQIKTAGDNLDALIVQANVYTDFGSFGKTGYQSSMYELDAPIVNVYHDNSTNINDRDNFVSHFNDITENSTETFDIVLADLDEESDTVINTGAKLIINIPREWNFTQLNNYAGFVDPPTVTVHSDKSTQIVGVTNAPIGDGVNDARKISFDAKAPDVKIQRLYIMYVLADGTVTNTSGELKTIGPLNEMVLNVDP